ncbi:nitrate- and nitrite sensing domain-containing protein [Actinocorallia sp. B10E7]|uniref:nitrate- and nitrite sensing domain-containing protein n=1 Tax=Actinocorallia sp. B10E7 TaxID=3153558 RepID=UPI00325C68AF
MTVPLVTLVALWGFAASVTLKDSFRLARAGSFLTLVVEPVERLTASLQHERRMSLALLADSPTVGRVGLQAQRARTDEARALFVAAYRDPGFDDISTDLMDLRTSGLMQDLERLDTLRTEIDGTRADRATVLERYTELVVAGNMIFDTTDTGDVAINRDVRAQVALAHAHELIAYEDSLLTGALTAGAPTREEHAEFIKTVGAHRSRYAEIAKMMNAEDRAYFERLQSSDHYLGFQELEDRLVADRGTRAEPTIDAGEWHTASERWLNDLVRFHSDIREALSVRAVEYAEGILLRLALAGGLGLIAVVVSITFGVRTGGRMVRENRRMVNALNGFTDERLPTISELVHEGAEIDPDEGMPPGDFTITEVAQVHDAFAKSRRAVIAATVSEVAARRGLGEVFVNLARRNQVLLQRLLRLLDAMERKAGSPEELNDLFEIDHLVTRMRRHAEGLVILAGRPAGRTWRRPVPVVDVVRAAVAEIEEYQRVKVPPMPDDLAVAGTATADVVHLLAELIENATMYSPPEMQVRITAQAVAHGLALEVEDRGLGLDDPTREALNQTLSQAPDFDLFDSARLGLFVVARLAKRHDISVRLRPSPYGGTTAIVLLPPGLLVEAEEPEDPGPPSAPAPRPVVRPEQPVAVPVVQEGELPRRVRQRNLAPQLREQGGTSPAAESDGSVRPPEQARSLMSAMQQGWQRGREEVASQAREEGRDDHDQ